MHKYRKELRITPAGRKVLENWPTQASTLKPGIRPTDAVITAASSITPLLLPKESRNYERYLLGLGTALLVAGKVHEPQIPYLRAFIDFDGLGDYKPFTSMAEYNSVAQSYVHRDGWHTDYGNGRTVPAKVYQHSDHANLIKLFSRHEYADSFARVIDDGIFASPTVGLIAAELLWPRS
ncbi:hypothetical protein [Corynebacterium endometrii]|uniref:Uncharacterized protein n=1 Tax=Corynebacterium endometrii TaxID=2488819 RepID=A0A4P7QHD3_9CORY|nr:hypothetical protein [Corynebacterium endometrii]QCB29211.1 hypothetical protein CENDO_09785 [Corynebacterium endometrii]